ncbi:MAG: ComEC/Rec2 family competence protein [Terriglobales bacterium]
MKPKGIIRSVAAIFFVVVALTTGLSAKNANQPLRIYFVDVEGGQATLFVTPAGQSLLVDTGWPGHDGRDGKRIAAAAKDAGIKKIDYVVITHFHEDHVGGVPQLVSQIPVGTFIDHGENRETNDPDPVKFSQAYFAELKRGKYKRLTVKPGDKLPLNGIETTIVSGDGNVIDHPLAGAGQQNPGCTNAQQYPADQTENARSLGMLMKFGKLRILDLGDLTSDRELQLMCPVNKLGHVDIYIVSHHGWKQSGSPALVGGIDPRVAIMDNGARKGGSPSAWDIIHKTPGVESLWQLHYSEEGGEAHNSSAEYIANVQGGDDGHYLELTAWPDGRFVVLNSRTGTKKEYSAR